MSESKTLATSLVDVKDCCLILIDVQQGFLDKLPRKENRRLVKRLLWLVKVAVRLGIPLVVTAEDIKRNGSVIPKLERALPVETEVHNKMVFNLAADPKIMSAVQATGRKTAVLTGLETDVCVAHSALGLLEQGYRVVALEDACASPGKAHAYGLARIRGAGALLSDVKSLYYEWLRTVEASRKLHRKYRRELGDPGITL